ncbi:30S ribosomal protein S6 [Candidatus Curtissbacteria bacterium]|nr:30S ribosomal protein S6 [Candidatus Curtissbacteria bacterium]
METKYEIVGLFPTKMNDIVAEKTLADLCKASKFKIVEVDKWGVKPLAYPIKKEAKAYYLRLLIEGGDSKSLLSALKVDESLLRYLLVRLNEKKEKK